MAIGTIWVFAEADGDRPASSTLEMVTRARQLGDRVEAVFVGTNAAALAPALGEHGATRIHAIDPGTSLSGVVGAAALAGLVAEHQPDAILFAHTYDGRDAAARLSVKLDRTVITNAVRLDADGDGLRVGNDAFGGSVLVETAFVGERPWLAVVRPRALVAEASGGGPAEVVPVSTPDTGRAGDAVVLERHVEEREGPKLEEATVVVAGGRGVGSAEDYTKLVEELAHVLGGATGASRAIVDAGWVPYAKQVGQTGKTVKPKVYLALGISGATQHIVGMKGSDNIIAVNKDGDAPIFDYADLGIVGDVHQVVPKLIEALKARS